MLPTLSAGAHTIAAEYAGITAGRGFAASSGSVNLSIGARAVTITADAKAKTYGDADPALTHQITSGTLAGGDAFSGSLARAAGDDVGSYAIGQGSVALSPNYALAFVGANLSIGARALDIIALTDSKTYDARTTSSTTPTYTGQQGSDTVTGLVQSFDSRNVGARTLSMNPGYAVNDGNSGNNYTVVLHIASGSITERSITITANNQTKVYGDLLNLRRHRGHHYGRFAGAARQRDCHVDFGWRAQRRRRSQDHRM